MFISKKQVLKALDVENLETGNFISINCSNDRVGTTLVKDDPNCAVCAVGSVLRHKFPDVSKYEFANICILACNSQFYAGGCISRALKEKNYLGALSIKFENLRSRERQSLDMTRKLLKMWVGKNFPVRFKVKGV